MNFPGAVMSIINANGNRMVGKTRLQKSAYFLERMNLGFGFDFDYHYYGPYSEDLSIASEDAKALGLVNVEWETSNSGMEYAVYSSTEPSAQGGERFGMRQEVLSLLERYDATSLELAATADFLSQSVKLAR